MHLRHFSSSFFFSSDISNETFPSLTKRLCSTNHNNDLAYMSNFEFVILFCLQKEIALYTASKINSEFCWFDIDGDIDSLFKVIYFEDYFGLDFQFIVINFQLISVISSQYQYVHVWHNYT